MKKTKWLAACMAACALALVAGCSSEGGDDGGSELPGIEYDAAKWVIEDTTVVRYIGAEADVRIPDGVTIIEDNAFKDCKSLKSVTIPNGVTSIGESAFEGCTSLESVTIPASVMSIGRRAFYYCESLKSVRIPDGVTAIEDFTFSFCDNLASVTIGNGVKRIERCAFQRCGIINSLTIPGSVKIIESMAFFNCRVVSVTIDYGVEGIESDAFSCFGTSILKEVKYGGTAEQWKQANISPKAFSGTPDFKITDKEGKEITE